MTRRRYAPSVRSMDSPTPRWHLAQYNVATLLAPIDDPANADFVAGLDEINGQADRAPGFVWRHQDDSGNSTAADPYGDGRTIINFAVWESREALVDYTFSGDHLAIMRRRREWFARHDGPYLVCWWIPAGTIPTVAEAVERLEHLRVHGPTDHAFGIRDEVPPPGALGGA